MSGIDKYLSGSAIISALLGTSCCAIQLFLNAFSFGCAGMQNRSNFLRDEALLCWTPTIDFSQA